MKNNPLYSEVYPSKIDRITLREILSSLDHVTPNFISREKFEEGFKDSFLVETGEGAFGKKYDLFLPVDLKYIELLRIIDFLTQKFDIEKYSGFDELLIATKVAVGKALKDGITQEDLDVYIQDSGISPELLKKIASIDLLSKYSVVKNTLVNESEKKSGEQAMSDIFGQEFEKTFFRRGINLLRRELMTFTQEDAKKTKGSTGEVYKRMHELELDKIERHFEERISLDSFRGEIELLRKNGKHEDVAIKEKEFCNTFIRALKQYPFADSLRSDGSLTNILKNKEAQCVGFSMIAHAYFNILGIKHRGVSADNHSYLLVSIGGEEYVFDASQAIFGNRLDTFFKGFGFYKRSKKHNKNINIGDAERVLFSQLYYNKGIKYEEFLDYEMSIKMYQKSLEIYPNNFPALYTLGNLFRKLSRYEESIEVFSKAYNLRPDFPSLGNRIEQLKRLINDKSR